MDLRRLRLLVELEKRGTMTAVAHATGYGTSAVSQQLAALEREVRTELLERDGRGVRLTPAAHRLVVHARRAIATLEEARGELDASMAPAGRLRVAAFASGMHNFLRPVAHRLAVSHPQLELTLQEREPAEVAAMLESDEIDLGLVYDYTVHPHFDGVADAVSLVAREPIALAVSADDPALRPLDRVADLVRFRHRAWIANSRGSEDDELASRLCGLAGFEPAVQHRVDSLELVEALVASGLGVGFLPRPAGRIEHPQVTYLPLTQVTAQRRVFLVHRPGRGQWPPLALVRGLLVAPDSDVDAPARSAREGRGCML